MKTWSGAANFVLLFLAMTAVAQAPQANPDTHKAEAEKLKMAAEAAPEDRCVDLCLDAAKRFVDLSDEYFTAGNVQEAQATMQEAARLAEKAGNASIDKKKKRKQTEIGLRKLEKRISDIEQSLNFEDRPAVHEVGARIGKLRSQILMSMFDMPGKELGPGKKD